MYHIQMHKITYFLCVNCIVISLIYCAIIRKFRKETNID